jgi:hypothetical protein
MAARPEGDRMTADLERFRDYIEEALDHADGSHSFEDVKAAVDEGQLFFWSGPNSVIITEIIEYPQYKTLHFFIAGGKLAELEAMYPLVEEWGRTQGCDRATLAGRKGWERSFLTQRENWLPKLVVYEKKF